MDFSFTESMAMLRDSAREFAEKRLKPGALEWDEQESIPAANFRFQGFMRSKISESRIFSS